MNVERESDVCLTLIFRRRFVSAVCSAMDIEDDGDSTRYERNHHSGIFNGRITNSLVVIDICSEIDEPNL